VRGTVVTTNLNTGGTYTNVFTANSKDQTIVDNGDGTITITVFASGGSRFYDTNGKLVLRDPGEVRFAFDVDFAGTPSDPVMTSRSPTPSGSSATPPVATTSTGATSARTWWSSPVSSRAVAGAARLVAAPPARRRPPRAEAVDQELRRMRLYDAA
jgi:hypothetical protein